MKKNLLVFMMFVAISGFSYAQVVTDFEPIPMKMLLGGTVDQITMTVVPNPDMSGINTSYYIVKFVRDKDGVSWGGLWSALPAPVDVTDNKYVHVKVWKTGTSSIIAFMPDFEVPITLNDDIIIYTDNIEVNSIATPIVEVVLNVDMHGSGLTSGQSVYFSGDLGGIYGVWAQPGSNAANEMIDSDNDSVYSSTMQLPNGIYHFKFFKGAGWDGG